MGLKSHVLQLYYITVAAAKFETQASGPSILEASGLHGYLFQLCNFLYFVMEKLSLEHRIMEKKMVLFCTVPDTS